MKDWITVALYLLVLLNFIFMFFSNSIDKILIIGFSEICIIQITIHSIKGIINE